MEVSSDQFAPIPGSLEAEMVQIRAHAARIQAHGLLAEIDQFDAQARDFRDQLLWSSTNG